MIPIELKSISAIALAVLGGIVGYFGSTSNHEVVTRSFETTIQDPDPVSDKDANAAKSRLGISAEKPAEGPFVELPDGTYMVPYTIRIPATDVEFTMIPIPGGKFTMGSPDFEPDRNDDEGPQFEVTVEPFWMGKYEVTWREYQKYMKMVELYAQFHERGQRKLASNQLKDLDAITAPSALYEPSFTFQEGDGPDEAAATMSQFGAKQYTKWLSRMTGDFYRLPYEAEWEYACRAGTTTAWYFGDDPDEIEDHAWVFENSDECRQKVGKKKPNPWGLYDMYGNVAEWVLDQYSEEGYTHVDGKSVSVIESYSKPKQINPLVVRGGSFISEPYECRSASRLGSVEQWRDLDPNLPRSPWWLTTEPANGVGFRLLRPLNPVSREEMETFWATDLEKIIFELTKRLETGKGKLGTVDENLPGDIENLLNEK